MTSISVITHRGLEPSKTNFYSESSFEAFQNHLSRGFNIEFDPNPTKNGIIIMHDTTLERPTKGQDKRQVVEVTTREILKIPLARGHIPTFDEVINLIKKSNATTNSLHLKARLQTPEALDKIMEALAKHEDVFTNLLVFDVKPETAKRLKKEFPKLRLAPSVAHPYDIFRYNNSVGNTLINIKEALELRKQGLIDGVWGDEWDLQGENGTTKQLYTPEFFKQLHKAGLFVALVTPELHATSPGLYGGESHPDAKDKGTLFRRIREIIALQPDAICTDYPEEVIKL